MNFLSTSVLTAISTFIKLASNLVINKVVALYIGPAGVALIGQFQNFLSMVMTFGTGAINAGVTKYVAEYHDDNKKRNDIISASLQIAILLSLLMGLFLILSSTYLAEWFLKSEGYSSIFKVLGFLLIFISLNSILLSIINGFKRIKLFIVINITGSVLSLIITSLLSIGYGVLGALLSLTIVQSLIFFVTLPVSIKKLNISFGYRKIKKTYFKQLLAFSLMALTSTMSLSVTQILIRNRLIDQFSVEQAGYWQSVWMISSMYLMILTTAFSTYYLPKLSELNGKEEIRREIFNGYKIIIPFVLITAYAIYLLRDFIITFLFTSEFTEMRYLFPFQLLGDFFKMTSWILAYLMVAKAMTKTFILTEIVFGISLFTFSVFFTTRNGLIGVTQAYALNYAIYLFLMVWLFRKYIFKEKKKDD